MIPHCRRPLLGLVAASVLFASCLQAAASSVAPSTSPAKSGDTKKAEGSTPAATPAKPKDAKTVKEKEIVLPGLPVQRANGTWLSINADTGSWVLSFYDAKKKPMTPDVARVSVRWKPQQKSGQSIAILLPGGGNVMTGNGVVTTPRIFKAYVTLLSEAGDAVENFVVDYRDPEKK